MLSIPGIKDLIRTREGRKSHGPEFESLFSPGQGDPLDVSSYLTHLARRLDIDLISVVDIGEGCTSAKMLAAGSSGVTCELTVPRLDGDGTLAGLLAQGRPVIGKGRVFSKDEVFPAGGAWCDLIPMDSIVAYVFIPVSSLPLPQIARQESDRRQRSILAAEAPGAEGDPTLPFKAALTAGLIGFSHALMDRGRDSAVLRILRDILKHEGYSIGFADDKGQLIFKDGDGFERLAGGAAESLCLGLGCPDNIAAGAAFSSRDLTPEEAEDFSVTAYPVTTPGSGTGHLLVVRNLDIDSRMNSRRERLNLLSRFMSSIAHEIKNPLTGIAAGVQYLARKIQPGLHEDETVEFILSEINRLNRIVDDLYKIAKPPQLVFRRINLNDIVGRSLICLSEEITGKRLVAEQHLDKDMPDIEADADRLQQIFINIIKNAIEASPEGGIIRVETSGQDDMAVFRVTDSGPGISREEKEKIFEPFYSTKEKGSGLGLCISQRIADEHGGSIKVESPGEGGTSFVVEVPIRR